jgi:hypothetical protein|tara:strand:+ start:678 stop:827 length:150 start_codon:yes stop_codon:yes gene_type:complete
MDIVTEQTYATAHKFLELIKLLNDKKILTPTECEYIITFKVESKKDSTE